MVDLLFIIIYISKLCLVIMIEVKPFLGNYCHGIVLGNRILRGKPHQRGVTRSTRCGRHEPIVRQSWAEWSSILEQVRTHVDDNNG